METPVEFPTDRLQFLIGKQGRTRQILERMGGVSIAIRGGSVTVSGDDPLKVMKAKEVVRAIGLGFKLNQISTLFNPDTQLAVFDVRDACANERDALRQVGRIIGDKGKNKRMLEKKMNIDISINDFSVAAIGEPENLQVFKEAIEKMAHGSPHSTIYRHIEQRMAGILRHGF